MWASASYCDRSTYEREVGAVWYRDGVCAGRQEGIPRPGDYLVAEIGTQRVIVTRRAGSRVRLWQPRGARI